MAQGITELYNNNLLMSTSISSSFPISATTSPLPVLNEKALADIYLYQTDSIGTYCCCCVVFVAITRGPKIGKFIILEPPMIGYTSVCSYCVYCCTVLVNFSKISKGFLNTK